MPITQPVVIPSLGGGLLIYGLAAHRPPAGRRSRGPGRQDRSVSPGVNQRIFPAFSTWNNGDSVGEGEGWGIAFSPVFAR